jgi:hypothetical protein
MKKLFLASLTLTALTAFSQAPTGQIPFIFTNAPLWDFSGLYTNGVQDDVVTVQFVHAANGAISGTRTEIATNATENLYGSAFVTGRVFSTPQAVGFIVRPYKETLSGTINGRPVLAQVSAHGRVVLIPALLSFQTESVGKVCVIGGRCVTLNQSSQISLPAGMDGTWTLELGISDSGNKLIGSAAVVLSNHRVLNYTVSGSYGPNRQTSVMRLIGSGDTQGSWMVITIQGPTGHLTSLSGNVLGQKMRIRQ